MRPTDRYRKQHEDILAIATSISKDLTADQIAKDANKVRMSVANLIGKLQFHLTIEDQSVYPSLLKHKDTKVVHTAKRFMDEMGGIMNVVENYKADWANLKKMQEQSTVYIRDTRKILEALAKRIDKENRELYQLIDNLG